MARAEANTRMRDFYDVYVLTQMEIIDINPEHLKKAFIATCRSRGSETLILEFDEILNTIINSPEMQSSWDNYKSDNPYVGELLWEDAVRSIVSLKEKCELS